jgi:hypothetical protein
MLRHDVHHRATASSAYSCSWIISAVPKHARLRQDFEEASQPKRQKSGDVHVLVTDRAGSPSGLGPAARSTGIYFKNHLALK